MKKYLFYIIITLSIALYISTSRCSTIKEDRDRLSSNQQSLMEGVSFYRTSDSLNAASVEVLTLDKKELKRYCQELTNEIEALNIKNKRLESAARTATETKVVIKTVVRDSIVYRDGRIDTLRCVDFDNRYVQLSGCEENGVFNGNIRTVDTLIQVVHRVPKKFLFFCWGTKAIRQEVVSKNPYSIITYTEYIKLK